MSVAAASPGYSPSVRDLYLELRGLRHHVVEWGAGDRTIVLLHGYLDHARVFDKLAARLDGFRLLGVDLRGHGDTDRVGHGGAYHFADYALDVHGVIAALARPPVRLLGHSMGGAVACYLAGAFPELVARLCLIEGIGPPSSPFSEAAPQLRRFVETVEVAAQRPQKRFASVEAAAARVRERNPRITPDDALAFARHGTRPDGDAVVWKFDPLHHSRSATLFAEELFLPFLSRITAPVLVVEGSEGFLLDDEARARRLRAFSGPVEALRLEGVGHHVQLEAPDALAERLRSFFD